MTVGELMTRMSGPEFDEWRAFYALEPFGDWRADHRAGVIAATVFNMNKAEKTDPLSPRDFMPLIERPEVKPRTPQSLKHKLMGWFSPKKKT
jgi:hypothetical protein